MKELCLLNSHKKSAFTLAESLIAAMLVGIFSVALMAVMRPNDIKNDALKKAGLNYYLQMEYATKQILLKKTKSYSFLNLLDDSNKTYSIVDSGADSKLISAYKKYLIPARNATVSATYKSAQLKNYLGQNVASLKPSSFTQGYVLKDRSYFALKLNKNCTTTESTVYNPSMYEKRSQTNSCGLIFFDVNGEELPNIVGLDQYIVPIGKLGLR